MERKITKKIYVRNVPVGGGSPISIQSMTNTITKDVFSTARQINEFVKEGCNISRSAMNDRRRARRAHAQLLWLHAVVGGDTHALVRGADAAVFLTAPCSAGPCRFCSWFDSGQARQTVR